MYTIALPGLDPGDGIDIEDAEYDRSFICPLTMYPVGQFDGAAFLEEMHTLNVQKRSLLAKTQYHASVENVIANGLDCGNMGMATIRGCGHQFAALPLLYNIMSRELRCPICRGGSNKEVNVTQPCAGVSREIWSLLCIICAETKERYKQETIDEEQTLLRLEHAGVDGTFDDLNFESINEIVAFRVIFSIYRGGAHTHSNTVNQMPIATVVFALQHSILIDSSDDETETIVFSCGAYIDARVCVCVCM